MLQGFVLPRFGGTTDAFANAKLYPYGAVFTDGSWSIG
jgi:hypothetical protein